MSMNLYPPAVHEGDLSPDAVGADIEETCNQIHDATKGFGTDENKLIEALAKQTPEDRYKIAIKYKEMFGKELRDVLGHEIHGDIGIALKFLGSPADVAECEMIKKACKGLGTKELILYPIVAGRTNAEIDILKKSFFNLYTEDLGKELDSELGGDFEKFIFTCLQGTEQEFDPDFHTDQKVNDDAEAIYAAGQGTFGTSEGVFFKILCEAPPEHLRKVNLAYAEKYGYTLFKALEKELRNNVEDASLFMLGMKLEPYKTVAQLINKACAGFGTNELLLTCTLIRYQPILKEVNEKFIELYGTNLTDKIKKECRGKYETLLVKVIDTGL